MNILSFLSGDNRTSIMHGIPIQYKDFILGLFRNEGCKIKIRYRGPRSHNVDRSPFNNRCSCLMKDATSFAIYRRT